MSTQTGTALSRVPAVRLLKVPRQSALPAAVSPRATYCSAPCNTIDLVDPPNCPWHVAGTLQKSTRPAGVGSARATHMRTRMLRKNHLRQPAFDHSRSKTELPARTRVEPQLSPSDSIKISCRQIRCADKLRCPWSGLHSAGKSRYSETHHVLVTRGVTAIGGTHGLHRVEFSACDVR